MKIWVFAIGFPMESKPSPGSTLAVVDQIVVSVGPYIFQTEPVLESKSSASFLDTASPPHKHFSEGLPRQPASKRIRQVTGVACIAVALELSNFAINRLPSELTWRLTISTHAPTVKGKKISSPAMSKDSVVTART